MLIREDIRRYAGELIVCGLANANVDSECRDLLRQVQPLGVILFKRNVESAQGVQQLVAELKHLPRAAPLLVAVDQEGGRVARLEEPLTRWPPMRCLGARGDAQAAHAWGAALAREVRALHIDVNFAPVLDVDTNPANPIIGDRSIGADPQRVGELGAAFVRGMQGQGVAACGKHFPGHGDTEVDSHHALPRLQHDLQRLRRVEWPPFVFAIAAEISSIMTAHVVVDSVDPDVPATLSARLLRGHLRVELGFNGVIIGDDTEMKALADHYPPAEIAARGLNAGVDIFLPCHGYAATLQIFEGLVKAAEHDEEVQIRLAEASERAVRWRRAWYRKPAASGPLQPWEEHRALAARLAATD